MNAIYPTDCPCCGAEKHRGKTPLTIFKIDGIRCAVFESERIAATSAPDGFPYVYAGRHNESDWSLPTTVEPAVLVNHWGTIFAEQELPMPDGWHPIKRLVREGLEYRFNKNGQIHSYKEV